MSVQARKQADRRKVILYATIGVVVIALIGVIAYYSRPEAAPQAAQAVNVAGVKPGQVAPDFTLSTTAGAFELAKMHDEPVLLEVFATWCPHCQRETIDLNQLYDANKTKVHFVSVNGSGSASETDPTILESQANVVSFGQRFGVKYPIAYDEQLTVANQYLDPGGFPTIVLIGRDGKVQAVHAGELPLALMQQALSASVAGKPVDPKFGVKDPPAG